MEIVLAFLAGLYVIPVGLSVWSTLRIWRVFVEHDGWPATLWTLFYDAVRSPWLTIRFVVDELSHP